MKDKLEVSAIELISSLILCIILGLLIGYSINMDKYDLPEEIKAISNNPSYPDTLTGFSDGNTIHIQYLNRHK